jgi:hypothetical protein
MRPPFHVNPDAHHCLQCTLRMAVGALRPDRPVDLDRLDALTARRPAEGTWTHAAYLALDALGLDGIAYDAFDYEAFARAPLPTVFRVFPNDVAIRMAVGFDLIAAAGLARDLLASHPIPIVPRAPTLNDVDRHLDDGWLLIANVDAAALDGASGASGHSVLVFDRDGDDLIVHDPGASGVGTPDRRLTRPDFERAWSFMGPQHRELLALRAR